MTRRIGLNVYLLKLKRGRFGEWLEFKRGGSFDAYQHFQGYFADRKTRTVRFGYQDPDTGIYDDPRAMKLSKVVSDLGARRIAGLWTVGEGGTERPVLDLVTHKVTGLLGKNQASLEPFFFDLHLEDGSKTGILLVQTAGISGIKTQLTVDFHDYFRGARGLEDLLLQIVPLADMGALKEFSKGALMTDVVLVNSGASQASRQTLQGARIGDVALDKGDSITVRIHKKKGFPMAAFSAAKQVLSGERSADQFALVPGIKDADDVLVKLSRNGRTRTFSLRKPDESLCRWDISEEVELGKDGHPTFNSLMAASSHVYLEARKILV